MMVSVSTKISLALAQFIISYSKTKMEIRTMRIIDICKMMFVRRDSCGNLKEFFP